jgi:LPXTG-site transpeptidase (sortase) family protein
VPSRKKRIAHIVFIAIAVPVFAMSATILVLDHVMPQFRATPAIGNMEVSVAVPDAVVREPVPVVSISPPTQLKIDKIGVGAVVQPVGLTSDGNMDIDENPRQAAWYKLGPKPGQEGSAVIAGHYGWKKNVPSVFNNLHTLVAGDKVLTLGEDGTVLTFVVTRLATYAPDQDATNVFRSDDGKSHLNLVTCQGSWNNTVRTYSERLVVFTDLLSEV